MRLPHVARIKSLAIAGGLGVLLLVVSIAASYTIAQQKQETKPAAPAAGKTQAPVPAAPPAAAPAAPMAAPAAQPLPVSIEQALYLIRTTLLTLNDANRSGNYTVLRDLAAPDFQARNTAADLGQIFSDLRRRNFDLYGAALLAPQLTAAPALDQGGMLHLAGYIPTRPQQIDFDLAFQVVAGQWRLFGISIATPPAGPTPPQAQAPPAKPGTPAPKNP